jgi:tripartite-type tricarboxylate transporter receptor subunit TctC
MFPAPGSNTALAQDRYPTRPVKFLVPYPGGGTNDVVARIVGDKLQAKWGQPVIIENRSGGGGNIGAALVAQAEPDGYTLLVSSTPPLATNQSLYKQLSYKPEEFVPITNFGSVPNLVIVRKGLPVNSLSELIAHAKANAGKLSYGHNGPGSLNQLTGEMFKMKAGLPELTQVPYRGATFVMADLISGQVAMGVIAITEQSLEFHRTGKLRILAVTSPARLVAAPDLPTVADAGFPDLSNQSTVGPVAPARAPKAIIEQIAQATRTALGEKAFQQKLVESGFEVSSDTTPEKYRRSLENDIVFWAPVVKALGLKID